MNLPNFEGTGGNAHHGALGYVPGRPFEPFPLIPQIQAGLTYTGGFKEGLEGPLMPPDRERYNDALALVNGAIWQDINNLWKETARQPLIYQFDMYQPDPSLIPRSDGTHGFVAMSGTSNLARLSARKTAPASSVFQPPLEIGNMMPSYNGWGRNAFIAGGPQGGAASLNVALGLSQIFDVSTYQAANDAWEVAYKQAQEEALTRRPGWGWSDIPVIQRPPLIVIGTGSYSGIDPVTSTPCVYFWVLVTDRIERIAGVPWSMLK